MAIGSALEGFYTEGHGDIEVTEKRDFSLRRPTGPQEANVTKARPAALEMTVGGGAGKIGGIMSVWARTSYM